ncbi:MAG TPA: hypothetical protein VJU52_11875 [Flavobacterium sp.]|nr:hypothetical protein [Flavobacterium sp.]
MSQRFDIKVKINSERPDFRVFASYFFGDDLYNYDSNGNSIPVTSRNWTELYMTSRQNSNLSFEIRPTDEDPLILEVSSEKAENANIIAYFLARETKGEILKDSNEIISLSSLIEKMGDFNLQERLSLADKSIWRKTTEANPYPNLNNN